MTTYYVGKGGNDGNSGLSWATRKLTLNGAEDVPVVANDTVIVGAGTYRELLTVDVSGTAGNPITYIGDHTGAQTDGLGGTVLVTGSDDDLLGTRANCVLASSKNYRTFRGITFELSLADALLDFASCTFFIIEDCVMRNTLDTGILISGASQSDITIRRCIFTAIGEEALNISEASVLNGANHLIENCLFLNTGILTDGAVGISRVADITVKNCTFYGCDRGVEVLTALDVGQSITVNNCVISACDRGLGATTPGEIVENYNAIFGNLINRSNTATGANSDSNIILLEMPILLDGFNLAKGRPWFFGALESFDSHNAIAGTGEATDDLFGGARPTVSAKKSWGAIQFPAHDDNETTTVDGGTYSLKMDDAGRKAFSVPVKSESTTIRMRVYREASYAGTNPQFVIKQPGEADITITDAGASGQWNTLTTTFIPASTTSFIIVEVVSNNTAVAGSYAAFFDQLGEEA